MDHQCVAQGSVFAADGVGLGPDDPISTEASTDAPLSRAMAGVSIKIVDAGGAAFDAILHSVSPTRVTAILPSEVPVRRNVGGAAPRIRGIENDRRAFLKAANPEETLLFEGTGLCAVSGDEGSSDQRTGQLSF